MALQASVDLIGQHTATGAGSKTSVLGSPKPPGQANFIGSTVRIFQFTGMDGTNSVDIEGSLNGTDWVKWAEGLIDNTAIIVDDGPLYMRSNCTVYNSGTINVYCQTFLTDN